MKANRKLREDENDKGLTSILGMLLMLSMFIGFVGLVTMLYNSFDQYCQARIRQIDEKTNNINNGNNGTEPYVEYEFNSTTQQWDFWYCVGHEQLWVKLTPDIKTQQNYTLDIIVTGKGTVTKQPMLLSYQPGTQVLVNATPNVGWCFIHWADDFNSTDNPATIIMNSNKVVYAVFQFINT